MSEGSWWALPGPSRALSAIRRSMAQRGAVVLSAPIGTRGWFSRLLAQEPDAGWVPVDLDEVTRAPPLESMRRWLGVRSRSLHELVRSGALPISGRIVLEL